MGYVPTLPDRNGRSRDHRNRILYAVSDPPPADEPIVTEVDRRTQVAIASGSSFELVAGLIAIVVAIVGLAGYAPVLMAAIATIAVGFALVAQGGTIAARWQHAVHIAGSERTEAVGIGTELLGGMAAITLGILALLGIMPMTLIPIAALVAGAALLFGGPAQPHIAEAAPATSPHRWHVTRDAVRTSGGVMVMAGVAALVLGILGLVGGPVVTLSAIAMLCIAGALVLAGGTLAARFARRFA